MTVAIGPDSVACPEGILGKASLPGDAVARGHFPLTVSITGNPLYLW
jgi:hypothetical protein